MKNKETSSKIKIIYIGLFCALLMGCQSISPFANVVSNNQTFVKLSDKIEVKYRYINKRILRFVYHEDYNDLVMEYKIFNDRHRLVQSEANVPMPIKYGKNNCELALQLNEGRYILEVTNNKNVKKYLHFYLYVPFDGRVRVSHTNNGGRFSKLKQ